MTAVIFKHLWLSPVSVPALGQPFKLNSLEHDPTVNISSRVFAAGNYRMVETPGRQKFAKVILGFCIDRQVAQLKDWQGVLLCFRDPTGEKFFGFYGSETSFVPRLLGNSWTVNLTVQEVTYSEDV